MARDNLARVNADRTPLQRPEAPQIKHKKNPRPKGLVLAKCIRSILCAAFIFAIMSAMIYGKVEMSRLTNEQSELQEQLARLEEANLSLESELESQTSFEKVEDYAENVLGLTKLDKTQIEYIELENDRVIEVIESDDGNVFTSIKDWFDKVLEYIGI